jgi:uncharacterized membrane protein YraQ (UPF0718 family)
MKPPRGFISDLSGHCAAFNRWRTANILSAMNSVDRLRCDGVLGCGSCVTMGDAMARRIDKTSVFIAGIAVISGGACYALAGSGGVTRALANSLGLFTRIFPLLVIGVAMAGLIQVLVSHDFITRRLGRNSGFVGILLASAAGVLTPGGVWSAMPMLAALGASGADAGAMVAYFTAWSLIGVHRVVVWEIPLMGADFSLLRVSASLLLPIVAGLLARQISRVVPALRRES